MKIEIEKLKQNSKYEYVYAFENNYVVFRTFNHKMGVINSAGNVVIKPVLHIFITKKDLRIYSK
ncbi:hypothetical protein [Flavobacterium psychrophilum]|uniref:hypothetical protein n=1 Tax=Flavobacterium psychrophilum TaxID=96345 RepID=UPI000B8E40DE|nr:hypothetical protein [Flavobacterium psychrophilum]ELI6455916.1 hypothetical protein [Flavobacterium psychrophilum]